MSRTDRVGMARRYLLDDVSGVVNALESAAVLVAETGTTPKRKQDLADAIAAAQEAIRPALALAEKLTKETTR